MYYSGTVIRSLKCLTWRENWHTWGRNCHTWGRELAYPGERTGILGGGNWYTCARELAYPEQKTRIYQGPARGNLIAAFRAPVCAFFVRNIEKRPILEILNSLTKCQMTTEMSLNESKSINSNSSNMTTLHSSVFWKNLSIQELVLVYSL